MTLQAQLDSIAKASAAKLPEEIRAIMHRETEALIQSGAADRAPKVGDAAPELELDGPESTVNLGIERADSAVVLTWFRGNWWPYCVAELEALQTVHAQLEELGVQVFAVSPQLPEHSRRMEKRLKLDFPILFDEGNQTAAEWGLTFDFSDDLRKVYEGFGVDLPTHHGAGGWTLPMPARFVVAAGGLLQQAEVHPDYTKRPEPETTVEIVRGLE